MAQCQFSWGGGGIITWARTGKGENWAHQQEGISSRNTGGGPQDEARMGYVPENFALKRHREWRRKPRTKVSLRPGHCGGDGKRMGINRRERIHQVFEAGGVRGIKEEGESNSKRAPGHAMNVWVCKKRRGERESQFPTGTK